MDASKYLESKYISLDVVQGLPEEKRQGVLLNVGEEVVIKGDAMPQFNVEIAGKAKVWRLNRSTLANFIDVWGADTSAWLGKSFYLRVTKINNKDRVVGYPVVTEHLNVAKDINNK